MDYKAPDVPAMGPVAPREGPYGMVTLLSRQYHDLLKTTPLLTHLSSRAEFNFVCF
jgi:hypothetical protein